MARNKLRRLTRTDAIQEVREVIDNNKHNKTIINNKNENHPSYLSLMFAKNYEKFGSKLKTECFHWNMDAI